MPDSNTKPVRRRRKRSVPISSEKPFNLRKALAQWLPFAFTVVVAVATWLTSNVSANTSLKQQVVQTAAHQIEQDAELSKHEEALKRLTVEFVPRLELTRQFDQQEIRQQRLEDKVDRILQNQASLQESHR